MSSVVIATNQSVVDIVNQTTGNLDSFIANLDSNGYNATTTFFGGEVWNFDNPTDVRGIEYQNKGYTFTTGNPVFQMFGDYNNDYNNDYFI